MKTMQRSLRELKKIKTAWLGLNYTTAKGVLILSPSKPAIAPTTGPQRLARIFNLMFDIPTFQRP